MGKVDAGDLWLRAWLKGKKGKPDYELRCLLGAEAPKVVDGYARWNVIDRPKRRGITEWAGTNPPRMEVSLLIDHYRRKDGERCEKDMRTLELMAGFSGGGDDHPPLIRWDANAQHDDREAENRQWVIEKLEWGQLWWNKEGPNIIRAEATITLMLYVHDTYLTHNGVSKNKKKKKGNSKKGKTQKKGLVGHVVKKGEKGLGQIAAKRLGNAARWVEIADLNGIRDPENIKVGQELKLP